MAAGRPKWALLYAVVRVGMTDFRPPHDFSADGDHLRRNRVNRLSFLFGTGKVAPLRRGCGHLEIMSYTHIALQYRPLEIAPWRGIAALARGLHQYAQCRYFYLPWAWRGIICVWRGALRHQRPRNIIFTARLVRK